MRNEKFDLISLNQLLTIYPSFKKSWIRSLIFNNKIPHYKIGGLVRFELNEIEAWIEDQKVSREAE